MAHCDDVRNFSTRRRNLLFLMHRFLLDNGYYSSAEAIKAEAKLSEDYELCDNVDLDAMYLEYASYYNMRFGKYPKFLKKSKPAVKVELAAGGAGGGGGGGGFGITGTTPATSTLTLPTVNATTTSTGATTANKARSKPSLLVTVRPNQQQHPHHNHHNHHNHHHHQQQQQSHGQHGERVGDMNLASIQTTFGAITPTELQQEQARKLQITAKKLDVDTNDMLLRQLPEIEHAHSTDDALFASLDWQQLGQLVKTTILRDDIKLSWADIGGNQQAIDVIKEAVLTPIQYPQLFANGLKPWRSVLLHGPPGSGKTLLAKVLYAETQTQVTFFNITSSIMISKWRGESEKILRVLFNMAERRAPSVIFFDEIEGLTSKRDRAADHESSKRFKNELLQLLDGMEHALRGVFILASTNLPWDIDEAFLRRFEKKLLVELPNAVERAKLIGKQLPTTVSVSAEQMQKLVKLSEHFTGDEIRLACKEIAMQNVRRVTRGNNVAATTTTTTTTAKTGSAAGEKIEPLALDLAFERIKPLSLKLMAKHVEWQQLNGSSYDV